MCASGAVLLGGSLLNADESGGLYPLNTLRGSHTHTAEQTHTQIDPNMTVNP